MPRTQTAGAAHPAIPHASTRKPPRRAPVPSATPVQTLAQTLAALAEVGEKVESAAASLLHVVRVNAIRELKDFDEAIAAAYEANGWNVTAGRQKAGSERRSVPHTVRQYVWEIRSGFREGLQVWTFTTFYALRLARKNLQAPEVPAAPGAAGTQAPEETAAETQVQAFVKEAPELEGVRVSHLTEPTGAVFHDLIVAYVRLEAPKRADFVKQLSRLLRKVMPLH